MATILKWTTQGFVANPLPAGPPAGVGQASAGAGCSEFHILPFCDGARPNHALIAFGNQPVRVNGSLVVGGLRVLQHKDEILVGSQCTLFSAESVPVIEVYRHEGAARRPRCPVCRAEIQDGQSVVRCPGCSRLYHQIEATGDSPAKLCWTYSPTCRFCDHPTSMTGERTWHPDQED